MNKDLEKKDYLSKEYTTCINGIFIVIVFISHLRGYISINPFLEYFCSLLSQLMVAMFLFNSGYGIGISIKNKGMDYIKKIPQKRILHVWLMFVPAILIYALLNIILGQSFSPQQFILSILAWLNLGNSNWYIFVILCLYFITFLSFYIPNKIFKKPAIAIHISIIFLSIFLIYILYLNVPDYWYNTISAYIFGLFFAFYKDKIEKITGLDKEKINIRYIVFLLLGFSMTFFIRKYAANELFLLLSIAFTFSLVMLMKHIHIRNKALHYLGTNLFQIYILMRLPMIVLLKFNFFKEHRFLYSILSFVITIIIASIYKWCYNNISKLIKEGFRRKS